MFGIFVLCRFIFMNGLYQMVEIWCRFELRKDAQFFGEKIEGRRDISEQTAWNWASRPHTWCSARSRSQKLSLDQRSEQRWWRSELGKNFHRIFNFWQGCSSGLATEPIRPNPRTWSGSDDRELKIIPLVCVGKWYNLIKTVKWC